MLKELGRYKNLINPIFYQSEGIRKAILGKDYVQTYTTEDEIYEGLRPFIKSHLYVDDVMLDMGTYLFYDVTVPYAQASMKTCHLVIYTFCNKEIIDTFNLKGYEGNRVDIMCQLIEEAVTDPEIIRKYGIGKMQLRDCQIFTRQKNVYGKILDFEVPNFM